ncbi:MAG: carbon monoxide dehydrogenase [Clostridia bacterium]|nr:carbon monoxide dehydrogenase [Clostridia bacterium]
MNLYDKIIKESMDILEQYPKKELKLFGEAAEDVGEHNLILRSDMAYELGGGSERPSVSGIGYTTSKKLVHQDEAWLIGPDLSQISEDSPYARVTFFLMEDGQLKDENQTYAMMRKVEYTRYHLHPKGFMMRISAAENQEVVRIGKEALADELDFSKVAERFRREYHKEKKILAVKMYFVTLPEFPYKKLRGYMEQSERITDSLNHIFQNLKMDCSVCGLKEVCDEVEGLKELHQTVYKA